MGNPNPGCQIEKSEIENSLQSQTFHYEKIPSAQFNISDTSVNEKRQAGLPPD